MRVAPEDPGGRVAPFQGMALSDITSGGPAAPAPDQIVLAPGPSALEAAPLGERLAAAGQAPAPAPAPETVAPVAEIAEASGPMPDPRAVAEAEITILTSALRDGAEPVEAIPASLPGIEAAVVEAPGTKAVGRTVRPRQRPANRPVVAAPAVPTDAPDLGAGIRTALAEAIATPEGTAVVSDIDPSAVAIGTRVVQLGAFDSEAIARGEWDRLQGRFGAFMAGKSRMIQKARSGGRDFWRLRAVGFEDSADARRFCSTLVAGDAACIPVTIR
ncbi:MAG: SPOR domain-containing protein [Pseudomonadota bacterium]